MDRTLPRIAVTRAYESPPDSDGRRILIDRIWPRGGSRANLRLDDSDPGTGERR